MNPLKVLKDGSLPHKGWICLLLPPATHCSTNNFPTSLIVLRVPAQGPEIAIFQTNEVMGAMNAWCIEHHGKSGLTKRVSDSTTSMAQAEEKVLSFIKQYVPEPNTAQLAGNSVHVDRMFLVKHMPNFIAHLNYRIVDVSSVKELARRWFPYVNMLQAIAHDVDDLVLRDVLRMILCSVVPE
ncbi:Oligoribonuclease [Dunaliella salina]|uniref:Oligoribonuclease n=1 Tax=Dunaliella salina TaxID=3046 RepID=A0ABQ7GP48_DUNSA|nr:Oligoribonuclease [Dunaliella salina]|eukprot:KAF5836385.1 Oligoribonuclease [Dunaliella salina]